MATVWINGIARQVVAGTPLREVLSRTPHPCGGKGVCGKCRIHATGALSPLSEQEQRHLTPLEIAAGVRLSCCAIIIGDCRITAPEDSLSICLQGQGSRAAVAPAFTAYGVAVDVGTTTLAARLYDAAGGVLAQQGCANPQSAYGADVLSRIEAAGEGAASALTALVREAVDTLIEGLAAKAEISCAAIERVVITGNTAMLCLLAGVDTTSLGRAPFSLPHTFNETRTARELGLAALSAHTQVYLPPCASAFIGADALCAALACGVGEDDRTVMLADMGTNGEILLAHKGAVYACSTAAGPAFEGVGISCGLPAVEGAMDRVTLVNGQLHFHTVGGGTPRGICGSGLVDVAACLLVTEELDRQGGLQQSPYRVTQEVWLTQEDVRALQQAKSAVCAGVQVLLRRAGLTAETVETLCVAGGFGSHLNGRHAAAIGLLPRGLASRIEPVGNAALDGAAALLLDPSAGERIGRLRLTTRTVSLSTDPDFARLFVHGMTF